MQLGNGRWESIAFNAKLQPTEIAFGTTQTATNLLKLDYSYGTTANNGNVQSQTIAVPTVGTNTGFIATQNYNYDSLNRLKDATENITPTGAAQHKAGNRHLHLIDTVIGTSTKRIRRQFQETVRAAQSAQRTGRR
jgi:hypothetical protein